MSIFDPLQLLADYVTIDLLKLGKESALFSALNFFIFDVLKIFILLAVIIFVVAVIRSYLPQARIKKILVRKNEYFGNVLASLIGIVTPFCTCSAIPLFLGFLEAGVPLGVTFSFLIASPMINEVALVLLIGNFGWKVALIYVTSGLVIAILAGIIIGKLGMEKLIRKMDYDKSRKPLKLEMIFSDRLDYGVSYSWHIIKKVWIYILIGVGLGAFMHGYVPADFLAQYASSDKWYAVPLATLLGIPLYSNAAGVIPLVSVLTEKGVATGTALSFMMAVTALSLPEFMILKRVMKTKLILIFAGIVGIGIMFTGYLFNFILK